MQVLIAMIMVSLLAMVAPAEAQASGKWIKGAPFPEPSEELVGMSAGGKFFVFGGLGPGWIPQGLVYEYDPATDKWTADGPETWFDPAAKPTNEMFQKYFGSLVSGTYAHPDSIQIRILSKPVEVAQ